MRISRIIPVISELAKSFAVCDHWYASAPCQTWPNRGFVHTGSSDGHINNDDYELYDISEEPIATALRHMDADAPVMKVTRVLVSANTPTISGERSTTTIGEMCRRVEVPRARALGRFLSM